MYCITFKGFIENTYQSFKSDTFLYLKFILFLSKSKFYQLVFHNVIKYKKINYILYSFIISFFYLLFFFSLIPPAPGLI